MGRDAWRLSVAPMMDWTDRHCRHLHRLITRRARLYTEMVTTGALLHGDVPRHLDFDPAEHPLALQLGGCEPEDLAHCARLAQRWGYDEINLNCGCPSERVQRGAFGACLMAEPALVGDCVAAMREAVDLPVTVRAFREDHAQSLAGLARFDCGPSAWVQTADGIDLVLTSIRHQGYGTDLFTGLGIDLEAKRAIVVKSTQHFHAAFAPLAQQVLYVDTPGLLRSDFEHMDYRRRSLNYWPRVNDPWNGPAGGTATDTECA